MQTATRVLLTSLFVLCIFAPMSSQAQATPVGVDLECGQATIDINVHPEQNQPVSVSCTVTNTGSFPERIVVDWSLDANDFNIDIPGETTFDLDAGADEDFQVIFSASPRIEVKSEDFNITATVTTVTVGSDPLNIPLPEQIASRAEVSGSVNSLPYSRMDLEVSNPSARNIEAGEEATIQFTIFNDGNRIDNLEVEIVNLQELEDAGFKFVSDPFFRATVNPGSSSDQGDIIIEAPKETSSEISIQVQLRAYSKLDTNAEPSEVSIRVNVAASSGGGGSIGLDDFSSMDQDNIAMIAMAGGGIIGVILLLVIISRLTKKAGKQKIAAKEAKKAAKADKKSKKSSRRRPKKAKKAKPVVEDDFEDELDLDDMDDMDDFDDDFDFEDL